MLRRCVARRCAKANQETIAQMENLWNIRFPAKYHVQNMDFHLKGQPAVPMYRVTNLVGEVEKGAEVPEIADDLCQKIMRDMVAQNAMDRVLQDSQRMGVISFYMTSYGEEGAVIGSCAGYQPQDLVFMQYREAGVMRFRGWNTDKFVAQCVGSVEDYNKGRHMPIHYGDVALNVQTVSSPLGTQLPHASGAGYAYRMDKASNRICVCYTGDGACSEGDFHPALNFAATLKSHTLFFVRNNGFAISTPASEQYKGDGIIGRALAFDIPSIRVDGNDVLAVYAATKRAREIIKEHDTPVMIEAMSYRVGDHSTSDDSTRYRDKDEVAKFQGMNNPIDRFGSYLKAKSLWTDAEENEIRQAVTAEARESLSRHHELPKSDPSSLFEDTFDVMTPNLAAQKEEVLAHYNKHRSHYDKSAH